MTSWTDVAKQQCSNFNLTCNQTLNILPILSLVYKNLLCFLLQAFKTSWIHENFQNEGLYKTLPSLVLTSAIIFNLVNVFLACTAIQKAFKSILEVKCFMLHLWNAVKGFLFHCISYKSCDEVDNFYPS